MREQSKAENKGILFLRGKAGKPHEVLSCDVVSDIYGLELCESKLYDDKVRTWIPKSAV